MSRTLDRASGAKAQFKCLTLTQAWKGLLHPGYSSDEDTVE
jgi:hypothetical protein